MTNLYTLIRHTTAHLRVHFSLFLLPVFLFALSLSDVQHCGDALLLFFILHLLVYPSSNGFNGWQDKDTDSIGGLEKPPPPPNMLRYITLLMDTLALILALTISIAVSLMLLLYILASRAYSHRSIRIKQYAVSGFLLVSTLQGGLIFIITAYTAQQIPLEKLLFAPGIFIGAISAMLLIAAGYPITQVYQHKQDKADGVTTMSMLLGIRGTLFFAMTLFAIFALLIPYHYHPNWIYTVLYLVISTPTLLYFYTWIRRIRKRPEEANYRSTMRMNYISAFSMNTYFLVVLIIQHFYLQ
jgi:1,4-dihydroxy-2-naphthoate polyprenyltransferase